MLLVPADSLYNTVPPRRPVFFNPRASRTRDLAVLAALAHSDTCNSAYLDAMTGIGARGIRVAAETNQYDMMYLNDANPRAIEIAGMSAALNGLDAIHTSVMDACRFLSEHSTRGERGGVVDIDPFGSPAPYIDCALRALVYGGMLAVTATDLQVLGGLHNAVCQRIYGGIPIKTSYGAETAIRLILGCIATVAGRLGAGIAPLYVESHMHYYRVYVQLLSRPGPHEIGYIRHCPLCGQRGASSERTDPCISCTHDTKKAGPLWIGPLFDAEFVSKMVAHDKKNGGTYATHLKKCHREATLPAAFYTLDDMASKARTGPPSLQDMMAYLRQDGFLAEATSFSPTGFRTNAPAQRICSIISSAKSHTN